MKLSINPGIGGFPALLFTILKLTGIIHWSWVWVLSPVWIPFSLMCVLVIFVLIIQSFERH
jgi:hypothetical protein